jgi:hypothetical protein
VLELGGDFIGQDLVAAQTLVIEPQLASVAAPDFLPELVLEVTDQRPDPAERGLLSGTRVKIGLIVDMGIGDENVLVETRNKRHLRAPRQPN